MLPHVPPSILLFTLRVPQLWSLRRALLPLRKAQGLTMAPGDRQRRSAYAIKEALIRSQDLCPIDAGGDVSILRTVGVRCITEFYLKYTGRTNRAGSQLPPPPLLPATKFHKIKGVLCGFQHTPKAPSGRTSSWSSVFGQDGTSPVISSLLGGSTSHPTDLSPVGRHSFILLNRIPLCSFLFLSPDYLRPWFSCPSPDWIRHTLH